METYTKEFYDDLSNTSLPSAQKIVPFLLELWPAASVIDIGCGNGSWLSTFKACGVERIQGVDGPWINSEQLLIPSDCFAVRELDKAINMDGQFDISMSLEVAEHLPAERADGFVSDLCNAAPVVFFSAAIPGQGGVNHINEQWPEYWAEKFAQHGYSTLDIIRPTFWNDKDVTWWYKQNCLLLVKEDVLASEKGSKLRELAGQNEKPKAMVHPELYNLKNKLSRPSFSRWIKMLPNILGISPWKK